MTAPSAVITAMIYIHDVVLLANGEAHASVMHPRLASSTTLMYLYSVPCETLSGGAFHSARRRSSSSWGTRSSMVFLIASTEMISPS